MNNLPDSFLVKEDKIKKVLKVLSDFDVVFKGGTSLSLTYGIIERFSEDIDVSFYLTEENKTIRSSIRESILDDLKSEEWIKEVECVGTDIFIHFDNEAQVSEYDAVIKPKVIKLELQDIEKKRTKPIASKIKPFEGAKFKMNVANPFSTFTDKTALLFELCLSNQLTQIIDDTKTIPRHLYDYLKIYKYLESDTKGRTISSRTKYVKYCKDRINRNILLKDKSSPRAKYDNSLWTTHFLKNKSIFPVFELFIKSNKNTIISIINSVVHPDSENFSIPSFLKSIKTNFKFYEGLLRKELNKKPNN